MKGHNIWIFAIEAIYNGKQIKTIKKADQFMCGDTCKGNAQGCA